MTAVYLFQDNKPSKENNTTPDAVALIRLPPKYTTLYRIFIEMGEDDFLNGLKSGELVEGLQQVRNSLDDAGLAVQNRFGLHLLQTWKSDPLLKQILEDLSYKKKDEEIVKKVRFESVIEAGLSNLKSRLDILETMAKRT
jgi:hypothetical protein